MATVISDNRTFGVRQVLGKNLNDSVVFNNTGNYSSIAARITAPIGGECCFEATIDGVNWTGITLRSLKHDQFQQTTDNNSDFIGSVSGIRSFRIRTCTAGSANGVIVWNFSKEVSTLEGIEFGWPPHRFGFEPINKDIEISTAGTYNILTPTTGKKFVITDLSVIASGSTDGEVSIFDGTDDQNNRLFKSEIEVATNKQFVYVNNMRTPYVSNTDDNVLKITTSTNIHLDVMVSGYEI